MKRYAVCLALSSLLFCTSGWACGDKLVKIGRGVRYQRANAVRPANILILVGRNFDRGAVNRLRSQLSVVGHKVMVATDADSLNRVLGKPIDIVLTDVDDLALVSQSVDSLSSKPTIVPMIENSGGAPAAVRRFPFVLVQSSSAFDQVA